MPKNAHLSLEDAIKKIQDDYPSFFYNGETQFKDDMTCTVGADTANHTVYVVKKLTLPV